MELSEAEVNAKERIYVIDEKQTNNLASKD